MKYLFSIIFILIAIIVVSIIYYDPVVLENQPRTSPTSTVDVMDDMDIWDCLGYSHQVTGEGVLAREAAMQSVVNKIIDFIGLQAQKVTDCF